MGFGGFGNTGARARPSKTEDLMYQISVNLEEVYNGVIKKIQFLKNIICKTCNGTGSL